MASAELTGDLRVNKDSPILRRQLRVLSRVATIVALLTSPAVYLTWAVALHHRVWLSLLLTIVTVLGFRGFVDVVTRRLIPWPSLYGSADTRIQEADIVDRRRAWYWRRWFSRLITLAVILGIVVGIPYLIMSYYGWSINLHSQYTQAILFQMAIAVFTMPILFLVNIIIIFGPLLGAGISQIKGFEPGDADWGVRLEDVRGQIEAKEEVRRVVTLWQSGELFEAAGGKRERGILFHGPPGTGKTMLAKGLATSFNAPFIAMPGSGFAQTFIGLDVIIVRFMVRKAKRLARKWGGTCIVFIDEIDAVGMRRQSLGQSRAAAEGLGAPLLYGPWGALGPQGDIIVENHAWREYIFDYNAPEPRSPYPPVVAKVGDAVNAMIPGMMGGGGSLALNQLLIAMDGVDSPPFLKRTFTNWINTWLDVSYLVPRRAGRTSLRLRAPKPRKEQVYFIGATNVPLSSLDPALMRPGRMGRHVWFRTPTKEDRKDIFELYLAKVAHDPELDTEKRRDEIARITGGYSPARIEQVCSLALTYAHHNGRAAFVWQDLIDAMSVIESGAAYNVEYSPAMARSTALHEAGHAAAAHVYRPELESARLSIRMRAGSFGHHLAREREESFGLQWQSESFGDLIHILGAMAAELVFYGQTENGVGSDLNSVTNLAAGMVGTAGMAPKPIPVAAAPKGETIDEVQERLGKRAEQLGLQLLNRTRSGGGVQQDPIASILMDPYKRQAAAQIVGQAFVIAYNFMRLNENKVERVAEVLLEKQEIYGDELTGLLDAQKFEKPEIDWTKDESWPQM
jgi:cell division protease FtsH